MTAGPEKIRRWWRYVIHRLAAYHMVWTLAGEYNMNHYGGLGLDFWKDLGARVATEDPFDHVLRAHPTTPAWEGGAEAPRWSTAQVLHPKPWLDYNESQTAHARWRNEYAPAVVAQAYAMNPPRPIVITEPWYEFARCPCRQGDSILRLVRHHERRRRTHLRRWTRLAGLPSGGLASQTRWRWIVAPRSRLRKEHPGLPWGARDGPHGRHSVSRMPVCPPLRISAFLRSFRQTPVSLSQPTALNAPPPVLYWISSNGGCAR